MPRGTHQLDAERGSEDEHGGQEEDEKQEEGDRAQEEEDAEEEEVRVSAPLAPLEAHPPRSGPKGPQIDQFTKGI